MNREENPKERLRSAEDDRRVARHLLEDAEYAACAFHYVGSRYPLDVVDPGAFIRPLAESAVQKTDEVFEWFLTRINFDNR
jgi:HEPN domain-containing protein